MTHRDDAAHPIVSPIPDDAPRSGIMVDTPTPGARPTEGQRAPEPEQNGAATPGDGQADPTGGQEIPTVSAIANTGALGGYLSEPTRVPAAVVGAIVAYRNACYRANGDEVLRARIALERAVLDELRAAYEGGSQIRAARHMGPPTDDEMLAWLVETAEGGDNMADTYRERVDAGIERHADDLAFWEREARCARGLYARLTATATPDGAA